MPEMWKFVGNEETRGVGPIADKAPRGGVPNPVSCWAATVSLGWRTLAKGDKSDPGSADFRAFPAPDSAYFVDSVVFTAEICG